MRFFFRTAPPSVALFALITIIFSASMIALAADPVFTGADIAKIFQTYDTDKDAFLAQYKGKKFAGFSLFMGIEHQYKDGSIETYILDGKSQKSIECIISDPENVKFVKEYVVLNTPVGVDGLIDDVNYDTELRLSPCKISL